ncbi:unnamed protein product [Thelazia callipaeda]|uniref:AT-rich interactive domain-containing protein 1B-like n=1 Tax=Thelazia callipaeda TaxID=103827 RepID=A0A0N5CWG8_THECL|nr:unnamed protein product [Thelazia callipaeda]
MSHLQTPSSQSSPSPVAYASGVSGGAPSTPTQRTPMYPQTPIATSQPHPSRPQPSQYPPPSCYQPKGQQHMQYPVQSPVFRQQQPQSVSVRTYLGNQPSSMPASQSYS